MFDGAGNDPIADVRNIIHYSRMSASKFVAATFLAVCVGLFMWGVVTPKQAEEIGFAIDDPSYLLGCYSAGNAKIKLYPHRADFDGEMVPISYGMRKTLREVIYPKSFPWFDPETRKFRFQNDRFDLLNLEKDSDGEWALEIWQTSYLASGDPDDLVATVFKRSDCD